MKEIYLSNKGHKIKICHFPGWTRYNYKHKIDKFSRYKTSIPDNLTIITVVDDDSVAYDKSPLIKQLNMNGIPFINAAEHKDVYPWVNNKKLELINDALKKVNTTYCLILDGIDVVIIDDLKDIIDIYSTYGKDIIYNASPWAHPKLDIEGIENRKELYGEYCYLNAGCCIGKTTALKKFYKECVETFNAADTNDENWESEQYFVRQVFAKHTDKIFFDYECKIFQVWHKTELKLPYINENRDIIYQIDDIHHETKRKW